MRSQSVVAGWSPMATSCPQILNNTVPCMCGLRSPSWTRDATKGRAICNPLLAADPWRQMPPIEWLRILSWVTGNVSARGMPDGRCISLKSSPGYVMGMCWAVRCAMLQLAVHPCWWAALLGHRGRPCTCGGGRSISIIVRKLPGGWLLFSTLHVWITTAYSECGQLRGCRCPWGVGCDTAKCLQVICRHVWLGSYLEMGAWWISKHNKSIVQNYC